MVESKILELKNTFYSFIQKRTEKLSSNSLFLQKIDDIIFLFITLTLFASTFMQSEKIGVFAIITVFLTFIKLLTKQGSKIRVTNWDVAIFVYFIICLISTINSTLLTQSIHGFLKTVIYICYYFCAVNYFQTNTTKIKYIFILVSTFCFGESVIAILQNFSGVEQIATWQDSNYINPEDAIARAYGTLKPYNPNLLGGYLLASIPYILGLVTMYLVNKKWKISGVLLAIFSICSLAVLVTGSRGAYLGLGAIIAGTILLAGLLIKSDFNKETKLKALYKKATTAILALFAIVLIAVPKITKRLLSIFILRGDSSTSFRMNVYNSSWQMFCDNWFLGIGAGNQTFREIYGLYMLTGYDALSTYSVPLEIAVESGILGLIAFFSFIILFLIKSIKFLITPNQSELSTKAVIIAGILVIMGVMTHGLFDTIFFRPQVQFLFWTMIAIVSALFINKTEEKNIN